MALAKEEIRSSAHLRVLIIDFNVVVQAGLRAILAADNTIEVVGEVPTARDALDAIRRAGDTGRAVDVVLTEAYGPELDGVRTTELLKQEFPDVAVLILTEHMTESYVVDAILAGAGGYLFMDEISPKALLDSIHRVVEGGTQITSTLLRTAVDALIQNGRKSLAERTAEAANLTAREVEVLRLLGDAASNQMIADALGVSLDTAKKHVRNVIIKLDARSRTHAAIIAAQSGLMNHPSQGARVEPAGAE